MKRNSRRRIIVLLTACERFIYTKAVWLLDLAQQPQAGGYRFTSNRKVGGKSSVPLLPF